MTLPAAPLTVGVCGAGTMGAGIAQVCLQAGHEVVLYDVDDAAIERGRQRVADGLGRLSEKGRLAEDQRSQMLAALREAHTLESVASQADVVIEAALEDLALKQTVFRALGSAARSDAVLATNTSALSISAIAESAVGADRVLGLHFFNPAPVMPLVEVVATDRTSERTLRIALEFVAGLGKTAVVCRDAPGFIVNRVNRPFTLEALRMLESGEASIEAIDGAVVAAGYPMGPFGLMDLVGLDVNYAVAQALFDAFGGAVRFAPSPIQRALVEAGRLGRKTGEGFYRYRDGRPDGMSEQLPEPVSEPPAGSPLTGTEIVERIELAIVNEAYHAAGEGVAEPPDIDRAMKLGASHPQGPFERAAEVGLLEVINGLSRLQAVHGERFAVAPALWQIASI